MISTNSAIDRRTIETPYLHHIMAVQLMELVTFKAYLPGTGETLITKEVPPGEAFPLHFGWADPCDYPKCG